MVGLRRWRQTPRNTDAADVKPFSEDPNHGPLAGPSPGRMKRSHEFCRALLRHDHLKRPSVCTFEHPAFFRTTPSHVTEAYLIVPILVNPEKSTRCTALSLCSTIPSGVAALDLCATVLEFIGIC
jgi:hypothetical protein